MDDLERLAWRLAIGGGAGAVGAAFITARVLIAVVGLCGDLTWTCTEYSWTDI